MTINYVTFHKVEFSDKNTRVYLTVENLNKKASVGFYDYDAKAMQGKKQYAKTYSFELGFYIALIAEEKSSAFSRCSITLGNKLMRDYDSNP